MERRRDRSFADADDVGNLCVGEVGEVAQKNDEPLARWERSERGRKHRVARRLDEAGVERTIEVGVGELLARIRTALRHRMERVAETPVLRTADVEIDNVRHCVMRAGAEVRLTPKEFELLSFLAKHAGRVVTHRQILTAIWGPAHATDTQYLRVYIGQIRQKIEKDPGDPRIIITEPGIGYRIAEIGAQ